MWRYQKVRCNGKSRSKGPKFLRKVCKEEIQRLPEFPKTQKISRNFTSRGVGNPTPYRWQNIATRLSINRSQWIPRCPTYRLASMLPMMMWRRNSHIYNTSNPRHLTRDRTKCHYIAPCSTKIPLQFTLPYLQICKGCGVSDDHIDDPHRSQRSPL